MTLAIKIGAGSQVYDNIALANSMRGNQKLSIVGTGEEIKAELTNSRLTDAIAANVGSIKATNDLNLTADQINTYKAALIKLGTKSIVLDTATLAADVQTRFNALDAVYTKIKSITISDLNSNTPTIAVEKLATAVNLTGLEVLAGKTFNVTGSAATLKANMSSLLKNIANIGTVTVQSGQEAVFNAKELSILGSKLKKADNTAQITLTDTADNLLTTSSLALINQLNNNNINATTTSIHTVAATGNVITKASHGFNTGDAVTYNGADGSATVPVTDGTTYYARKLSNDTFSLFTTYAAAINTSSIVNIVDPAGTTASSSKIYATQAGNAPVKVNTLDNVNITKATLAQADRLIVLTTVNTGVAVGQANRALSNIIKSVEIADTATKLTAGADTDTTVTVAAGVLTDGTTGVFSAALHGFTSGDRVTYSSTGTSSLGLTNGSSYYVGVLSTGTFVLYSTKTAALALDASGTAQAAWTSSNWLQSAAAGTGTQKVTASTLDKTMSALARMKDGAGSVGRVTIKEGAANITAATLNDFVTKVKRGDANAKATFAGKAVDITNALQALYDNNTVTTASHLDEIVVTDGTATGKKGFSMSQTFYTALNSVFDAGVDNVSGNNTNKNYSFTVTGATFANIGTLQGDVNVGNFAVVGALLSDLTTGTQLVDSVSKSKLKTITTVAITDKADQTTVRNLVNSIGSPTDRAKVKLITA
jgi:hypothetical protein